MDGFVVTGTDTGVGKTVVAAALALRLRARYWKPVQAGLDEETDSAAVRRLAPDITVHAEAYRLATPCSPHEAARIDRITIDPARLALPMGQGPLVVEGAGGALVPLAPDLLYADMMARWRLPVVLAARTTLGTINHSLLTIEALRSRGLVVAGMIFVGDTNPASEAAIAGFGAVRVLGRIGWLDPLDAATLARAALALDLP